MIFLHFWTVIGYRVSTSFRGYNLDSAIPLLGINQKKTIDLSVKYVLFTGQDVHHYGMSKIRVSQPQHDWHLQSNNDFSVGEAVLCIARCLAHPWAPLSRGWEHTQSPQLWQSRQSPDIAKCPLGGISPLRITDLRIKTLKPLKCPSIIKWSSNVWSVRMAKYYVII